MTESALQPDEIESAEFLTNIRGYDREEVREFLSRVAAGYRALLEEIDVLRAAPPQPDPLDEVTEVLRTANEAAAAIIAGAEARVAAIEEEARTRGYARGLEEVARRRHELVVRLQEVGDEVQLALLALGDAPEKD